MKDFIKKYKKQILLATCVLVVAALVVTVAIVLAKGKNNVSEDGTMIDEYGKVVVPYTTPEGKTVVDENGKLIVIVTKPNGKYEHDENGKVKTEPAAEPPMIEKGDSYEMPTYKMKLPKGWEQIGNQVLMLRNKTTTAKIDISAEKAKDRTLEEYINGFFEFVKIDKSLFTIGTQKITNLDVEVTTIARTYKVDDKDNFLKIFVYEKNKVFYFIYCSANTQADFDAAGFESIISTITYK